MRFTAIDFETANEKRSSPCALGITVFERDRIVEERYWLIKPHEDRFEPMNIWVHGITAEDVAEEPEFDAIWSEIRPYIEGQVVVAHNASFDMSVLRKTLDYYKIEYPVFEYFCTLVMSKSYFKGVENYKLNTVAGALEINFTHHHAAEDSIACGRIFSTICSELRIRDVEDIESKLNIARGKIFAGGYSACGKSKIKDLNSKCRILKERSLEIGSGTDLRGKKVVFTGGLKSFSRGRAMEILRQVGGIPATSVSKKVDILVSAAKEIPITNENHKSTKYRKAERLIKDGYEIKIIGEEQFLELIK